MKPSTNIPTPREWMKEAAKEILEWVNDPARIGDSEFSHCHDLFAAIIAKRYHERAPSGESDNAVS